jgi:hypothetical protein
VKIFISYSRKDAGDFARQIHESLMDEHQVFTDINNIQLGDIWSNTIEKNISTCDIFVVIVTGAALRSTEVEKEVLLAQRENKKIIPCIYRGIRKDKIKWGLEKIQGVEFTNEYQLARDLYSKIDIETDISRDRGTESIIGSTSKTIPDLKTNTITQTPLNIDKLEQKKETISTSPKVIKDEIQSKSSQEIPANTIKKEEKETTNYTASDTIDKPSQGIFGSISKPKEEIKKTDLTKIITPTSIKSETDGLHQKKDSKNYHDEVQTSQSSIGLKIILPIIGVIAAILLVVIVFVNPFGSETPSDNIVPEPLLQKFDSETPSDNIVPEPLLQKSQLIATDKSVTTTVNSPIDITLDASDENVDDEVIASIVTKPKFGTLGEINQATKTVTYIPYPTNVGTDRFEYKVNNGTTDSNNAVVTITINPPAGRSSDLYNYTSGFSY